MKKWFLMALIMVASVVQAAEVTVMEATLPHARGSLSADARFYMDTDTREGFVKVSVTEQQMIWTRDIGWCGYGPYDGRYGRHGRWGGSCFPHGRYTPVYSTVLSDTVKVEGLSLEGDKVVFLTPEGEVDCGTMGVSRVLRRPTLYLSGNCDLEERIVSSPQGRKVVVTLKTK